MTNLNEFIVFTDFHAHLWAEFSEPTGDKYVNTRFKDQVETLRKVFKLAQEKNTAVLFLGDLFHKRGAVNTTVFNEIFNVFREFSNIPTLLLRGNHDSMNNSLSSPHALTPFEALPNCTVVANLSVVDFNGATFTCVPYGEEIDEMKAFITANTDSDYLLGHIGIEGAKEGSGHSLEGAFSVKDLHADKFTAVLLGHYHKRQFLADNVAYVGSTVPTSFSDVEGKGVMYLSEEGGLEFIEIEGKQFKTVDLADYQGKQEELEDVLNNNYVRLKADTETKNILNVLGDLPTSVRVEVTETFDSVSEIGITVDDTPTKIVDNYFDSIYTEDKDKEHKNQVLSYINKAVKGEQ